VADGDVLGRDSVKLRARVRVPAAPLERVRPCVPAHRRRGGMSADCYGYPHFFLLSL
jgi:hypothetical protein